MVQYLRSPDFQNNIWRCDDIPHRQMGLLLNVTRGWDKVFCQKVTSTVILHSLGWPVLILGEASQEATMRLTVLHLYNFVKNNFLALTGAQEMLIFILLFVRLFIHSFVRLFICLFVHLFVCSFVCSFVHSFVFSSVQAYFVLSEALNLHLFAFSLKYFIL